jgi:hypothetical protein
VTFNSTHLRAESNKPSPAAMAAWATMDSADTTAAKAVAEELLKKEAAAEEPTVPIKIQVPTTPSTIDLLEDMFVKGVPFRVACDRNG